MFHYMLDSDDFFLYFFSVIIMRKPTTLHKKIFQNLLFRKVPPELLKNILPTLKIKRFSDREVIFEDGSEGKPAITHYRVLENLGYISLVECKLETGRTHQIRVHFSHIRHPLFNDEEYGGDQILKGTTFTKYQQFIRNCFKILPRQALHAKSLAFDHPVTGKRLYFESPLPDDMVQVIDKWRKYTSGRETELADNW